ncbi:hypothetical protein ACJZ2D_008116 [Fusarium nematophilum]
MLGIVENDEPHRTGSLMTPIALIGLGDGGAAPEDVPRQSAPKRKTVTLWTCCACGHGGMSVNVIACHYCANPRCAYCVVERVRTRASSSLGVMTLVEAGKEEEGKSQRPPRPMLCKCPEKEASRRWDLDNWLMLMEGLGEAEFGQLPDALLPLRTPVDEPP